MLLNRDDLLVDAARAFFFGRAGVDGRDIDELAAASPIVSKDGSLTETLDMLFGPFAEPTSENAAAFAFVDAARTMPAIQVVVERAYTGMQESLVEILAREFPTLSADVRDRTAYAVVALAIGNVFLIDVSRAAARSSDARLAAEAVVERAASAASG